VVEGPSPTSFGNQRHCTLQVLENIPSGDPQRLEPRVRKHSIALHVTLRSIAHRMRLAVDLDHQAALQTGEIDHVTFAGKLSAKAQAGHSLPKLLPQDDFRQCHLPAKLAREVDISVGRPHCPVPNAQGLGPSTTLRVVPLPVPGRI
jgi:hypothetical protein